MLSRDEFEKALESMLGAGALAIRNADRIESANHARCVHCLKTRDEHKLIEGIEDKCHYGPNSRVFQSEFDRAKVVEFVELLTSVLEMTGAVYDDIETLVLYRASARNKKG